MTRFNQTAAGAAFIASADSRETSREIMEAIAFFARNEDEAELIWNGDFASVGDVCTPTDLWKKVTQNGLYDEEEFCWGEAGSDWRDKLRDWTADFIASADSRETSREIMEAIAFFARNEDEAVKVWDGDFGNICTLEDIWEKVTKNGLYDAEEFCWGWGGSDWADELRKA